MERLQKVMARDGVASRRKSEKIITAGRVKVNGNKVTELGTKVKAKDQITVDNVPINKEKPRYILFYKPRKTISSVSDEKGRTTVVDYFNDIPQRIYPVGRLDYHTSGLLLLTNDGDLDYHLTHPKYEIHKTYVAKVEGILNNNELRSLRLGIHIDHQLIVPDNIKILESQVNTKNEVIQLTIHEGKNHEVKRLFKDVNHPVKTLKRESYSFLNLGNMKPGEFRFLKKFEVKKLKSLY